ncbi:MAG: LEA type 2 family protein [Polaribacter sp.]|nr:LEA type 2 family protein [Polaribacter sp.]
MKKGLYFLGLFLLMYSCSVKKPPVFLKVDDIKLISYASDTIRLNANAYFENPNDVGGKISTDEIKVIINGVEVAQVLAEDFKVPARKDFTIPLLVNIPSKNIFANKKDIFLGGLINSIITNKVKVQFKGNLRYTVFGFQKEFLVDKTEEIKIKF